MRIGLTVLGTGSKDCLELGRLAFEIVQQRLNSAQVSLKQESDVESIASYDVQATPALLINGVVVYDVPAPVDVARLRLAIEQQLLRMAKFSGDQSLYKNG